MRINRVLLISVFCLSAAAAFAQTPAQELNFFIQQANQDSDKKLLESVSRDINAWLARNSALPYADDALFFNAELLNRTKSYPAAQITLLKYVYEFPKGKKSKDAKELVASYSVFLEKNKRENFTDAANVKNPDADTPARLEDFLTVSVLLELKGSYSPLEQEFNSFKNRFPTYENMDKLELLLGDLHRQNKNYQAALAQYRKVYNIYPSNKYKAASLRMTGDVYADDLKNYDAAMDYYQRVLKEFPNTVEKGTTYAHMAYLSESKKNYDEAVKYANLASEVYLTNNQKGEAYDILRYKAQIEEGRQKNYTAAVKTLTHITEVYAKNRDQFVDSYFEIARINGKKLKDVYAERSAYQSIYLAYPQDARAPQALFKAAAISEKLGDNERAKEAYRKLIVEHPADSLAIKAQRRVDSIEKAEAKAAANGQVIAASGAPAATAEQTVVEDATAKIVED